ncbi:MAG: inositol monophosphatase [Chloroflexota bacterium]|nr:inositol monophosphatase [Chloroflexota bacterium]
MADELVEMCDVAIAAAREAGAAIQAVAEQGVKEIVFKGEGKRDLVTEADKRSEQIIIDAITRRYPDHRILAEEGTGTGGNGAYRWIVDPLDGTTNFAHQYPLYCVSIAVEHGGEPVVGVVFAPYMNELFIATKGGGATLNGTPIAVSGVTDLIGGLLCTGFPYRLDGPTNNLVNWGNFVLRTQATRRDGAAALDLCYVAAGRFDGFWELNLQPWDMAAGALIIQEAGGTISDSYGNAFRVDGHDIVGSNGYLHTTMLDVLAMSKNGHGAGKPNAETEQLTGQVETGAASDEATT